MTVVFWDIDGTLLTTARGGILALEDACRDVTGRQLDLRDLKSDGLTDHQLAVHILDQARAGKDAALVERLLRRYEEHLPARLPLRRGRALDGVREILAYLRARRSDVHSMLLTGNTAGGAQAKLAYYGLQEFFDGGAFSEDRGPRAGIAERALAAARARFPQSVIEADRAIVVGDTPHDIDCARAIGARMVAVATGKYSVLDLSQHRPWRVFDRLPEPTAFEALIDERAVEASTA